ncbi:nuclear transport factor 2 family protein [soil metagenome]
MDSAALTHLEAIRQLKARYLRFVDTKAWSDLRALFTEDATLHFTQRDFGPEPADEAIERISRMLVPGVISVHRTTNPEITLIDDRRATGIWPMTDLLRFPADSDNSFGLLWLNGHGYYHEDYVRSDEGWRIAAMRLDRTLVESEQTPGREQRT